MIGWIMYIVAFLVYVAAPMSTLWAIPLVIGILFHIKYWAVGIIAFLVGAGWKKPF